MLIEEGREQDQAVAICHSMWREKKSMDEDFVYELKGKRAGSPKPSDYLVVESADNPSTWHLPVKENGKPNHALMGAAWAALTKPGGHRGNKYEGPGKTTALKKLRALYKSEGLTPPGEKSKSFFITKQADGRYRWFAIFSNPYRDQDIPPEILTEAAQIDNVKAINDGSWPYPELWLWHIPGSRCGVADFAAYDTDSKLALASGLFDKGKERVVEALNSTPVPLKTSHGMPRNEISRDPDDPTILIRFRTKEISPLPEFAAANEITGFKILGEKSMNLVPEIVKEKLSALFPDEDTQKMVADTLEEMDQEAKEKELEFKDVEEKAEVEVKAEADTEKTEETPEPETETKSEAETEAEEPTVEPLDRKEVEDAITLLVKGMNAMQETLNTLASENDELKGAMTELTDRLSALEKSDEEKIAEKAAYTPRLSLSELIQLNVIGKEEVAVDGRKARHEGPQETKDETLVHTGNALMDRTMTDILNGGFAGVRENLLGGQ